MNAHGRRPSKRRRLVAIWKGIVRMGFCALQFHREGPEVLGEPGKQLALLRISR